MSAVVPPSAPRLLFENAVRLFNDRAEPSILPKLPVYRILGIRGYRRDTMGEPGVNDVGIFDDAIFLLGPAGMLASNANADPSVIGWNKALGKPFAQLKAGLWPFIRGMHKGQYPALRQPYEEQAAALHLGEVFGPRDPRSQGHFTVVRNDGKGHVYEDTGYHAINIHRGGQFTTSSWGCQTIPPAEWLAFVGAVYDAMATNGQRWIPYLLIDGPVN